MTLLTVIPGTLFITLAPAPGHQGKPESLLHLELSAFWHGELYGPSNELRVPVTYKVHIGVEVPVEVLDAVEFCAVTTPRNRAVACEYSQIRGRSLAARDLADKLPAYQAVVSEVLQPQAEA